MRLKIVIGILATLLLTASFTNPTKEQYIRWVKEKTIDQSGQGFIGIVASMVVPTIIDGTTKVSNYGIFSLYNTGISDEEITVLGVFNNFLEIGKQKSKVVNHNSDDN